MSPPCQVCWSPSHPKIGFLGIECLIFICHTHNCGFVVARGQHCQVQLWSLNNNYWGPLGKFYATSPKTMVNTDSRWCDFHHHDQLSPWQGRMMSPPAKRLRPPSQNPCWHTFYLLSCGQGMHRLKTSQHSLTQTEIYYFASMHPSLIVHLISPFWLSHHCKKLRNGR